MSKVERKEILISKLIDREDQPSDWRELRSLAGQDQDLWKGVLADLESECLLRAAGTECLRAAHDVELPLPVRGMSWTRSIGAVINPLGWIAALVMALLWIADPSRLAEVGEQRVISAVPIASEGDIITELPRVLVSSGPNEAGDAFELMYMRRFIERVQVDELLRMRRDESGQPFTTAVSLTDYRPTKSY
jgi:hypothetical protein